MVLFPFSFRSLLNIILIKDIAAFGTELGHLRGISRLPATLITLVALYILGVTSIKEFALPLIVGVVCGCYSSVFLASQFWVIFKGKNATVVAK